ncbi:MAG: ParA family protein [Oscillospiraceae bacterium]|jgi:chromosome partitioning protein|nr:ParA family protein [Oscillospiraceae bacterium]
MNRIIAVMNQKGGVGKTTTVVNLAACVAAQGKRVLVVDMDPQANTTSGLGQSADVGRSMYDTLISHVPISDILLSTPVDTLKLAPADIRLAAAEVELLSINRRESVLKETLNAIIRPSVGTPDNPFDYVMIDCPPSLGQLTINALTAADSVLIPIQCEYYALEGVGQLMRTIQMVKRGPNPSLDVEGVVLTMLDGRTNLGLQVVQEVKKHFKTQVYASVIPRNIRLGEAPSHGLPVHLYDPRSIGASAYQELAKEFIERAERSARS